ncbi:hypothetical protein FOXB_15591, partial [Fusarium oxysporum f. sp. conglutinans Fo5176]
MSMRPKPLTYSLCSIVPVGPSSMDPPLQSELGRKGRGRPRQYATPQDKTNANVEQRRTKRQKATSAKRDQQHTHFYDASTSSSLLPIPLQIDGGASIQRSDHRFENTSMISEIPCHAPELDGPDISHLLPPPTPPLEPSLLQESPLRNDEDPGVPLPVLGLLEGDTEDLASTATAHDAEISSPAHHADYESRVKRLGRQLAQQLIRFQGCCADCHRSAKAQHDQVQREHISLAAYLESTADICPEIISSTRIASPEDGLSEKLGSLDRRQVYCGLGSGGHASHICLNEDERITHVAGVSFDVDSVTGFPSSLAIAKQGIRWSPTQMPVSDLQSNLHLCPREVHYLDMAGNQRRVHRPVHRIPHYTFGRLIGFEDVSLYLLFPNLYREEQKSSRLRDEDFRTWMDGLLLPVIHNHYSNSHVQHYPSSYDHSKHNATARGIETLAQRVHPIAREQQLMYYLPPESLELPGFRHFRDVTVLLQAKNLKVLTKDITWSQTMARFQSYWTHAIDEEYVTAEFYFDVGKETCPEQASQAASFGDDAIGDGDVNNSTCVPVGTLLYKRCCLQSYAHLAQNDVSAQETEKQMFYPFSMLHDTGSLTIETGQRSLRRKTGLLYTQFYPSVKEVFAAGNVYPFTNTAIETLAVDKRLRRTWELVGGALSHQPAALMKAYLYTKLRCHFALLGSTKKSFGIREEHRVSKDLLNAIDTEFHSRQLQDERLTVPANQNSPYYDFTTETVLRWLRWNINKFCVGFEMVYSLQDPHFVTWEHTRIMLMFLRCLQFSYSGGLIQKSGGCWQDVRLQPDANQPDGLRRTEGLGFRHTMETYGYAWFLDKVDWETLTFKQPHAAYMMFNNPSMQAAYHARYSQVRDVRIDFIRVDKARQWMIEFSSVPDCLQLLEKYLQQLCLCAFRKDVFTYIKSVLHPDHVEAALAGEVPLCYDSVHDALAERHRPPQLAYGNRLAVKNIDVLFAWLWEWKDGHFERKGWKDKPYRMLFQQGFQAVKTARGVDGARKWRQELKKSFFKSHWMLPYPQSQGFMRKDKETKEFVWWPSFHRGLNSYYTQLQQLGSLAQPLPTSNIKHHPSNGWELSPGYFTNSHMPYVVHPEQQLLRISQDELFGKLVSLREQNLASSPRNMTRPSVAVSEFNISTPDHLGTTEKWCARRRMYVLKTFEESESPGECAAFLRKALEQYELLQHHQRNLRRNRRNHASKRLEVESDSDPEGDDDSEATSDEESLGVKRLEQAKTVRNIEARMRELITQHQRKEKRWPGAELSDQRLAYYYREAFREDGHFTREGESHVVPQDIIETTPLQRQAMEDVI